MIVADTGAMLALLDASEEHHTVIRLLYEENPDAWILPWATLPEIDYLLAAHAGRKAHEAFLSDLAEGAFTVEWGRERDLVEVRRICSRHAKLRIGLVDAAVIATAERLKADAIATLDLRHFAAISIKGNPRLLPRDR
jgi:hypothetical protein